MKFRLIPVLLFFFVNQTISQDNNFKGFKILQRKTHQPLEAASLTVKEFGTGMVIQKFSDSDGMIKFNSELLHGDSGLLIIRFATDTLLLCNIYKRSPWSIGVTLLVDTEAIKNRIKKADEDKKRRRKIIKKKQ